MVELAVSKEAISDKRATWVKMKMMKKTKTKTTKDEAETADATLLTAADVGARQVRYATVGYGACRRRARTE